MDERYDTMRSVMDRKWLYIHNYRPDLPYVQPLDYMFKARGYQSWAKVAAAGKLTPATAMFWSQKPTEELYDLDADPDNVKNLANDVAHSKTLERMRAALAQHTVEVNDNGFLPEGSALEGYDASRVAGAYPIKRVFELANLASQRDPANLPKFMAVLSDDSEPIRWWAAQGCAMFSEKASSAESALKLRLEDKSGAVQVAAAEALARIGKPSLALPVLERCLTNAHSGFFALQAANVLDRLGEQARSSLPALRAALKSVNGSDPRSADQYLERILDHTISVLDGKTAALVYPPH
jgi:HEAT repeat protein